MIATMIGHPKETEKEIQGGLKGVASVNTSEKDIAQRSTRWSKKARHHADRAVQILVQSDPASRVWQLRRSVVWLLLGSLIANLEEMTMLRTRMSEGREGTDAGNPVIPGMPRNETQRSRMDADGDDLGTETQVPEVTHPMTGLAGDHSHAPEVDRTRWTAMTPNERERSLLFPHQNRIDGLLENRTRMIPGLSRRQNPALPGLRQSRL